MLQFNISDYTEFSFIRDWHTDTPHFLAGFSCSSMGSCGPHIPNDPLGELFLISNSRWFRGFQPVVISSPSLKNLKKFDLFCLLINQL